MTAQFSSFIRVVEIWSLDSDAQKLMLDAAIYGNLEAFEKISEKTSFSCGEGLPGRAWEQRRPVLLKEFDETNFLRIKAAKEVGLTTGVAIPFFNGETLTSVLVILCGDSSSAKGAIEIWQDDFKSGLALTDGFYGDMKRFAWLSENIRFPKGTGLPGGVWKTGTSMVIGNLKESTSFMRSHNAVAAGITTGIGIPFYSPENNEDMTAILTFLSAANTPIARRFEVWEAKSSTVLSFACGIDQNIDEIELEDEENTISDVEHPIVKALSRKIPTLSSDLTDSGFNSVFALPIIDLDGKCSVVAFYN